MRRLPIAAMALLVMSAWIPACGSSGGSNPPVLGSSSGGGSSGAGGSSGSSSGGGSSGGLTFDVTGTVEDSATSAPLASVSFCLLNDSTACTTSDDSGVFTVVGVEQTGSGFTAALSGYVTGVWPFTPTKNVNFSPYLRSNQHISTWAGQAGAAFDTTSGVIIFEAYDGSANPLSGVTVTMSAQGKVAYFSAMGTGLDPTLTATTAVGFGMAFQIAPGNVDVTFSAPGLTCARDEAEGWIPSGSSATTEVPVFAGEFTVARAMCL